MMTEDRSSKTAGFFRQAKSYLYLTLAVWGAALLTGMMVQNVTHREKLEYLIFSAGLYLAALILLSALVFARDWNGRGWAGASPRRAKGLCVFFTLFFAAGATGFLIAALSR